MDHDEDPISQFFPGEDEVDLYAVLDVKDDAQLNAIKKAYRRLALVYHPDKHATASDDARARASLKFQQIGFAYAVLGDEKRRSRYDLTGKTDEAVDFGPGEDGWEAYFQELFERVTKGRLDELKKEYQGSSEEIDDLKNAYTQTGGEIGEIMNHIPHSTHEDEPRFINLLDGLISSGDLSSLPAWESGLHDEKARLVRQKQTDKEAKEAEELAKDLGVWDEFYGSGKPSSKRGKKGKDKGKRKQADDDENEGEDYSALQALMLKRKKKMDGFFDSLAAKYGGPGSSSPDKKGRAKRRAQDDGEDVGESPKKKTRTAAPPPDIDDDEFAKLQAKLFDKERKPAPLKSKGGRSKRPKS